MITTAQNKQDGRAGFLSVIGTRSFLYHSLCFGLLGSTYALYKHGVLSWSPPPPLPPPLSLSPFSPDAQSPSNSRAQATPAESSSPSSPPSQTSSSSASTAWGSASDASATEHSGSGRASPHHTRARTTNRHDASSWVHTTLWYALGGGLFGVLARAGLDGLADLGVSTVATSTPYMSCTEARVSDSPTLRAPAKTNRRGRDVVRVMSEEYRRAEQGILEQIKRRATLADRDMLTIFDYPASPQ